MQRIGIIVSVLGALGLSQAVAETAAPAPYPDVAFKRIGVPKSGTSKRITVQIREGEQPYARAPEKSDVPAEPNAELPIVTEPSEYAWYWSQVSPVLGDTASRFGTAITGLDKGPSPVPAPRLEDMHRLASTYGVDILTATVGTHVSPALVLAVIGVESSGRSDAVSHAGAQGLMQLMPATAERFGVADATVPAENIRGGVKYLDWLLGEFGGDPVLALAGYNAGENAVKSHDGVPPYAETRAYVPKVLAAWRVARGLCVTPPELISDGCVFAKKGAPTNG